MVLRILLSFWLIYTVCNAQIVPQMVMGTTTSSGHFAVGSYEGNRADDRAITGIGFTPDVVVIKSDTVTHLQWVLILHLI
jgi:hypothetical protein